MSENNTVRKLCTDIVYGPVQSRRFGISLGLNISGKGKYCSFNCIYCFRGKNDGSPDEKDFKNNLPSVASVLKSLEDWMKSTHETIDDITFAGNAEPTNHPDFPEIVDGIINLRNRYLRNVEISVLTNGTGLIPRLNKRYMDVKYALEKVENPCLKLDSGVPDTWRMISRPYADVSFSEWLDAIQILDSPIIQTILMKGFTDNTTSKELLRLKKCYEILNPRKIHVINIDKPTAVTGIYPVEEKEFEKAKTFLLDRNKDSRNI
jgi:wyosine [tRNA(Phe)-imidazoG37] synthetase (radical SAM superfamily)